MHIYPIIAPKKCESRTHVFTSLEGDFPIKNNYTLHLLIVITKLPVATLHSNEYTRRLNILTSSPLARALAKLSRSLHRPIHAA